MRDTAAKLASLMGRYATTATLPAPALPMAALGIDALDLPILLLDIEDAFGIEIGEEAITEDMTLADIAAAVDAEVEASAKRPRKSLVPVSCRPWMDQAAA